MQGLYTVNNATQTATSNTAWIEPGIHENLKLVEVKYDISKNGKEFLAFYVENENGDKVSNTEWPFKMKKPLEEMTTDERDIAISIIENQKSKVKQIVEIFKPGFNIEASSFKEFAEKTIAFLGDTYKDKLFRLKVVYDKRGYTTFAQSARYVFIEGMDIERENSKIRILPSDRLTRPPREADQEVVESNPLDIEDLPKEDSSNMKGTEDAPF